MKEMQGNSRILIQLKDFDERKSREIAARAYQQREIKKLEVIIKTIAMWSFHVVFQKHVYKI